MNEHTTRIPGGAPRVQLIVSRESHCLRNHAGAFPWLIFLVGLALLFSGLAAGQNVSQARIFGIVTDSTGAGVPGVKVVATSQATGSSRTAQTEQDGSYLIPQVTADTYDIEVSNSGFKTGRAVGVLVEVNQNVRRDFQLEV